MRGMLKGLLTILGLLMLLVSGIFAQEGTDSPDVVLPTPGTVIVVPEPVEEAPATEVSQWVSPEVMAIAGSIILIVFLLGAFVLLFKALDALKISVPAETINLFSEKLVELVNTTRESVREKVEETTSPIDNMVFAIADVPLEHLLKEVERRRQAAFNPPSSAESAVTNS